jgi:hypothetical protein
MGGMPDEGPLAFSRLVAELLDILVVGTRQ